METEENLKLHLELYKKKALYMMSSKTLMIAVPGVYECEKYSGHYQGYYADKSIGTLPFPAELIGYYLWDNSNKRSWDPTIISTNDIRVLNKTLKIVHEVHQTGFCMSNRNFVYAMSYENYGEFIDIMSSSVDIEVPVAGSMGYIYFDFTRLTKLDNFNTKVTRIRCYDLNVPFIKIYSSLWYGRNYLYLTRIREALYSEQSSIVTALAYFFNK